MTAEISILNKTAIVLAGDSAVTIGDGRKVYNTANKIFKLTNKGTVGIMIYNQANWMGIPLETIIKTFNSEIADKTFPYIEDYKNAFIEFLKAKYYKYVSEEDQSQIVKFKSYESIQLIAEIATEILEEQIALGKIPKPTTDKDEANAISIQMVSFLKFLNTENKKEKKTLTEFTGYKVSIFRQKYQQQISNIVEGFAKENKLSLDKKFITDFGTLVFDEITHSIKNEEDYSGIVIAGFGEDEIFPKIVDFKLAELFENRLRISASKTGEIDNNRIAVISPFAQRGDMGTV